MHTSVTSYRVAVVLLAAALAVSFAVALTGGQRADAVDGPVEVAYVATGQNFPDALAGANLAATVGAPMLTVNRDLPLPDATVTALEALDPNQIIILGGPVAVSDAVKGALGDYTRSGAVTRIEGGDRHATAAQIAEALPDKVHDADKLDGLDAADFLRASELGRASAVVGTRDRSVIAQPLSGMTTVQSLDFMAPTDGFVFVSATANVRNPDLGAPEQVNHYLVLDWDGDTALPSVLEATIAGGGLPLEANGGLTLQQNEGTLTLTSAVPVTAGAHTLDLLLSATTSVYSVPNIAVVFSPTGAASPPGMVSP